MNIVSQARAQLLYDSKRFPQDISRFPSIPCEPITNTFGFLKAGLQICDACALRPSPSVQAAEGRFLYGWMCRDWAGSKRTNGSKSFIVSASRGPPGLPRKGLTFGALFHNRGALWCHCWFIFQSLEALWER